MTAVHVRTQDMLESRWQINRRSLANARNRVQIAVASLDCIVADRGVIEAMVGRWVTDTFLELDRLGFENELPRGSAAALPQQPMPLDALEEAMQKLASPLTRARWRVSQGVPVEELPAAERAAFEAST